MAKNDFHSGSVRAIIKALKKLNVEDGDTLAVRKGSELANGHMDDLREALEHLDIRVILVVIDSLDDVRLLNETAMNRFGWFRMAALNKLIHIRPEEEGYQDPDE
jgi:hypothetical protein